MSQGPVELTVLVCSECEHLGQGHDGVFCRKESKAIWGLEYTIEGPITPEWCPYLEQGGSKVISKPKPPELPELVSLADYTGGD